MNKYYNFRYIKLSRGLEVKCATQNTRYGFRHVASIKTKSHAQVGYAKACYYNRTWEMYTYQSVIHEAIENCNLIKNKKLAKARIDRKTIAAQQSEFKLLARVAKMGSILTETKAQENAWKVRMLKAGLENKGLVIPSDWNTLTEEEKETRLNNVIKVLEDKKV
jgi:hypothetical protein